MAAKYGCQQRYKGKLFSILIDEVKDHPADHRTPTGLLNILDAEHLMSFDCPGPEGMTEAGLVEPTTYREAYKKVGLYETYAEGLDLSGFTDEQVYQVTPKGNTLLFIDNPSGVPSPKHEKEPVLEGLLPGRVRIA